MEKTWSRLQRRNTAMVTWSSKKILPVWVRIPFSVPPEQMAKCYVRLADLKAFMGHWHSGTCTSLLNWGVKFNSWMSRQKFSRQSGKTLDCRDRPTRKSNTLRVRSKARTVVSKTTDVSSILTPAAKGAGSKYKMV